MKNEKLIVLATGGDTHLGGRDFDRKLFDHTVKKVEKEQKKNYLIL